MSLLPLPKQTAKKRPNSIGYYDFEKSIGQGNFAKVKLARHCLTGEKVAIKIIDKEKLDQATFRKLFREVRILKLLHHPFIVRLYEVIDTPTELFLVMEYVSGGEIFDYLVSHGKMKEKDARRLFCQILTAIDYCHTLRIIHRDLKAENLLLDSDMNVKIADFGFSNNFEPDEKLNTWCGSPPYAAPELYLGKEYSGPEVDIWSLGVVLYVLVCGHLPFDASNLQKLRGRVLSGKFKVPVHMSRDCERIIKSMLVLDPAQRIKMEDLKKDAWLADEFSVECHNIPAITEAIRTRAFNEMEEMGFSKEVVQKAVYSQVYDQVAATFFLLTEKFAKADAKDPKTLSSVGTPRHKVSLEPLLNPLVEDSDTTINETCDQAKDQVKHRPRSAERNAKSASPHSSNNRLNENSPRVVPRGEYVLPTQATRSRRATFTASPITALQLKNEIEKNHEISQLTQKTSNMTVKSEISDNSSDSERQDSRKRSIPRILAPYEQPLQQDNKIKETRKRAMTVEAKQSHSAPKSPTSPSTTSRNEPRRLRFSFSSSTTSSYPAPYILNNILMVLSKEGISHEVHGYCILCSQDSVQFEIEICQIPRLSVHGIRTRRLAGNSWHYKKVLDSVMAKFDLK